MTILSSYAAKITPTGITAPSYADILESLKEQMQAIFGSDIYLESDSQDGQMLAIIARAFYDANATTIAAYNSFSPVYAQGVGLSSQSKINGIRRLIATNSQAVGNVSGVAGTIITGGVVADGDGNLWNLPSPITIPDAAVIAVTVTAQELGAINAPAGTITKIQTPVLGWQSFLSTSDATPGNLVETDAALRRRQALSVSLPANTPLAATLGAVVNITGVERARVYENDTNAPDANGLPAHSISAVVQGGDVQDIVNAIGAKKTPGCATYGTTNGTYVDPITGISYTINFFELANSEIKVALTIAALTGFSTPIKAEIQTSIANYLNSLGIGQPVQYNRLFAAAYLNGAPDGLTYEITAMTIALGAGSPGVIDLVIPFNSAAVCTLPADVVITGP